ncbi:hypothetical protein RHSIM_Rhsim10G0117700 [Rhododendron simsii]|uniref:Uncharacterized protein n=1 Tax=Rhododendron simsii TaxID=118357 RepID=A0A834LBT4_RHOSS|nr:hypothetical protein RHSIM_Rhsim10G0117700 [Rhododendron simsii]
MSVWQRDEMKHIRGFGNYVRMGETVKDNGAQWGQDREDAKRVSTRDSVQSEAVGLLDPCGPMNYHFDKLLLGKNSKEHILPDVPRIREVVECSCTSWANTTFIAIPWTKGKLNAFESLELSRLVVNQIKKNLLENWLAEDKLECREELGDLTGYNDLALKIYIKAKATPKVGAAFAECRESRSCADLRAFYVTFRVLQSLVEFFVTLSKEWALGCMKDLLLVNLRGNLQIICFKSNDGLYFFLGLYLSSSEDPDIQLEYIEFAAKIGQNKEVERVIRESNFYDAEKTKNFLMEANLPDA